MFGNTKVLGLALGLAAIVVVLYNVHVSRIRNENTRDSVELLRYKIDRSAGDKITDKDDIEVAAVPRVAAVGLKSVVSSEARLRLDDVGRTLGRSVQAGQWIQWDDFAGSSAQRPADQIQEPNGQLVTLPLDPRLIPGKMLRAGDRVDIWGAFQNDRGELQTFCIISGLRVYGIGGQSLSETASGKRTDAEGVASYRDIQVVIRKDVVDKVYNVLSNARGQMVWVTIRNPKDPPGGSDGQVNPLLNKFAQTAVPSASGMGS
jgi:hypothetical protein